MTQIYIEYLNYCHNKMKARFSNDRFGLKCKARVSMTYVIKTVKAWCMQAQK